MATTVNEYSISAILQFTKIQKKASHFIIQIILTDSASPSKKIKGKIWVKINKYCWFAVYYLYVTTTIEKCLTRVNTNNIKNAYIQYQLKIFQLTSCFFFLALFLFCIPK